MNFHTSPVAPATFSPKTKIPKHKSDKSRMLDCYQCWTASGYMIRHSVHYLHRGKRRKEKQRREEKRRKGG
jgi:hypothetical protein